MLLDCKVGNGAMPGGILVEDLVDAARKQIEAAFSHHHE